MIIARAERGEKMADVVIREWVDEKGWIHRMEIPLKTFLREHDFEAVVRCKDCRKYIPCQKLPIGTSKWCGLFDRATCEMNYCGWGGRKREDGKV